MGKMCLLVETATAHSENETIDKWYFDDNLAFGFQISRKELSQVFAGIYPMFKGMRQKDAVVSLFARPTFQSFRFREVEESRIHVETVNFNAISQKRRELPTGTAAIVQNGPNVPEKGA